MTASIQVYDSTGATEIFSKPWGEAIAGETQTAEKLAIKNNGSRNLIGLVCRIAQVANNDGHTQLRIGADTATVIPPYEVSHQLSATGQGGIWGATGTYYYVVTAFNGIGETNISDEISAFLDDTSKKITVTWSTSPGASGYRVYRSTTSGNYSTPALVAELNSSGVSSYTDNGAAPDAGSPPSDNTTAGAAPEYGTPPTLSTDPMLIGTLKLGQYFFFWLNREIGANVSETGNPRAADLVFTEE